MHVTILIPHYKEGRTTAYAVAQILKFKGDHKLDILVIDNNSGDGSIEYLWPFLKDIAIVNYPKERLQSHGISFDYVLPSVKTKAVITTESDAFPTSKNWLDSYALLVQTGFEAGGSLLQLSGGSYLHPCGAFYLKSIWQEAQGHVDALEYDYYPNFMMRDNFPVHTMIHKSMIDQISANPEDWVELSSDYKGRTKEIMKERLAHYSPVGCGVFHNGMGGRQESFKTYGHRTVESEKPFVFLTSKNQKIIGRMGLEPGQYLSYYMEAANKKIKYIPTETKWLANRENEQQEYTIMNNGFTHIWAGSSYLDMKGTPMNDVYEFKSKQIERLYQSLPEHQKIK